MDWISVNDRLPYSGVVVLAVKRIGDASSVTLAYVSSSGKWRWANDGWEERNQESFTHWMPLPEPPTCQ